MIDFIQPGIEKVIELLQVPGLSLTLPVLVIGAVLLTSRALRLPLWLTSVIFAAPLCLLFVESPFIDSLIQHGALSAVSLSLMLSFAISLAIGTARLLWAFCRPGSIVLTCVFVISLAVVTVLLLSPEVLEGILPGWQKNYGLFLLTLMLFALCLALFRFVRAGVVLAAWGFLCFVLGTEVFLHAFPESSFFPQYVSKALSLEDGVEELLRRFSQENKDENKKQVIVLGGESASGGELAGKLGYPQRLERLLNTKLDNDFDVIDLSPFGLSALQALKLFQQEKGELTPEVAVLGGWFENSIPGNFADLPGLSETEASAELDWRKSFLNFPIVSWVVQSRLFRTAFGGKEISSSDERKPRVSPEEFSGLLSSQVKTLQERGITPILVFEPLHPARFSEEKVLYREAMKEVAKTMNVVFVDLEEEFQTPAYEHLFDAGTVPSAEGQGVIARRVFSELRDVISKEDNALVDSEFSFEITRPDTPAEVLVSIEPQPDTKGPYRIYFSANHRVVGKKRLVGDDAVQLRFPLPASVRENPSNEFHLSLRSDEADTNRIAPNYRGVVLESHSPQNSAIDLAEGVLPALWSEDAFQVAVLEPETGLPIRHASFPAGIAGENALRRYVRSVPWGKLVAFIVRAPHSETPFGEDLHSALRYLGAEEYPEAGVGYAFLGVAGGSGSTHLAKGEIPQRLEVRSVIRLEPPRVRLVEVLAGTKKIL